MATSGSATQDSFGALSRFMVGGSTLGEALQLIVELAGAAIPPARYTGLTMLVGDHVTTWVFSDPDVPEIDQAQYEANSGPCVDAFRDGRMYAIPSTETDERWPEFSRAALEHGVRSSLSVPLIADASLGALNFYAVTDNAFSDHDELVGASFAAQAAVVLANVQTHADAQTLNEQLQQALESRAVIDQAKGILMAHSHVAPDAAFEMLRSASQRENRKLRDVARDLVERHSGGPSTS